MRYIESPQASCRFALAQRDITPPVGIYHRLWGAARHDQATGVHRPLRATTLVFQAASGPAASDANQVVVALDLCGLGRSEMLMLLEKVSSRSGVPSDQLMCVFSHTHASGWPSMERLSLPGGDLIPAYLDLLATRVAEAVVEARQSVRPVSLLFGRGDCPMATHRDFWDEATGQFVCGFNPDGKIDQTVLVVKVVGADNRTAAVLVNYACHPTTLAWENSLISPDFPGAMVGAVEKATGAPCVFLQGASGEVGPREGFVGDPAIADRNGRQLAYAALSALEAIPPPGTRFQYTGPVISGATLGTWAHRPVGPPSQERYAQWRLRRWEVPLAYRSELPTAQQTQIEMERWQTEEEAARQSGNEVKARDCRAMVERMRRRLHRLEMLPPGAAFPLAVWLWRTGDAFWLAVEAEHYSLLQSALRERFPDTPVVVMTLANGSRASYLPTADAYGKGIYQESIAVLAPGSLEQLIEIIEHEMAAWKQS